MQKLPKSSWLEYTIPYGQLELKWRPNAMECISNCQIAARWNKIKWTSKWFYVGMIARATAFIAYLSELWSRDQNSGMNFGFITR